MDDNSIGLIFASLSNVQLSLWGSVSGMVQTQPPTGQWGREQYFNSNSVRARCIKVSHRVDSETPLIGFHTSVLDFEGFFHPCVMLRNHLENILSYVELLNVGTLCHVIPHVQSANTRASRRDSLHRRSRRRAGGGERASAGILVFT